QITNAGFAWPEITKRPFSAFNALSYQHLMKFIVAQVGARRGYAVPAILQKAGMLERFYTDIAGDIGFGAIFSAASALPLVGKSARRLVARRLPSDIRAKTTTF